jgi:hypothetical protein
MFKAVLSCRQRRATFSVMVTKREKVLSIVIRVRYIYIYIQCRRSRSMISSSVRNASQNFFFSTHIYTWSPTLLSLYWCLTYPRGANVFKLISFRDDKGNTRGVGLRASVCWGDFNKTFSKRSTQFVHSFMLLRSSLYMGNVPSEIDRANHIRNRERPTYET